MTGCLVRRVIYIVFVVVFLALAAIWGLAHAARPSNDVLTPNSDTTQQQSANTSQSPMFQQMNVDGWQITLQSAHIDNSYPIYYQAPGNLARLILHVSFSAQQEYLPQQMNSDDLYVIDLASKITSYCVSPSDHSKSADWTMETRGTGEGDTVCLINGDIQTAHTYQILFVDKGINDQAWGGSSPSGGTPMWDITVKNGAIS